MSKEQMRGDILVVDDNPNNLGVLSGILQDAGYKVRPALGGELALRAAELAVPDLVLLDIRMPQMNGYEVAERLRANPGTAGVPIIFISALQDAEDKVSAFKSGGVDYIVKPFQAEEVLARVRTHINLSLTRQALEKAYAEMESRVEERSRELLSAREEQLATLQQLETALVQTVDAMGLAMEKRDPYTAGHQHRVADLAVAIATELGMSQEQRDTIRLGGLIHDIGKISIPAELLTRPGRISDLEMNIIRTHPTAGYDIIKGIAFPWPIADIVLSHHERVDGTGYPHGLRGEEIIPEARVVAVADVLEAMTSYRPYRPALGLEVGMEELRTHRGTLYDADAVDAMEAILARPEGFSFADSAP